MKKIISIALALSMFLPSFLLNLSAEGNPIYSEPYDDMQTVKEYRALEFDVEKIELKAEADYGYNQFINRYDFADEKGYYKKVAVELAALGITQGSSNKIFNGGAYITNVQAITMFVRMFGEDRAIETKVRADNPKASNIHLMNYIYDAYVEEAKNKGLLENDESIAYHKNAKREDIAYWFVKSAGLENKNPINIIEGANDYGLIPANRHNEISTLLDLGIMTIFPDGNFKPKAQIRRRDFGKVIEKTLSRFEESLNVERAYGIIIGIQSDEEEGNQYQNIILRNKENKVEKIRYGIMKDQRRVGFPVLIGNDLHVPDNLAKGMEIEYLIRDGKIILVRVLENEEVKYDIVDNLLNDEDVEIVQGEVKSNKRDEYRDAEKNLIRRRIRTELTDDRVVDFIDEKDKMSNIDNSFLVKTKDGFFPAEAIPVNQLITAYIKDDKVLLIEIGSEYYKHLSGQFRTLVEKEKENPDDPKNPIIERYIVMETDGGKIMNIPVDYNTNYSVNYYRTDLKDLKPGASIKVATMRGRAEYIKAYSYQAPEGYISKGGKIDFVKVKTVWGDSLELFDRDEDLPIASSTLIKKNGENIPATKIVAGDMLKLYFDDIYSKAPNKIIVETKGPIIEKIIKADIVSYDKARNMISVKNVRTLSANKWIPENTYKSKFKLGRDMELYFGDKQMQAKDIDPDYINQSAYLVIRNNMNGHEIGKMVYLTGKERNYNDSLSDYDDILQTMYLNSGRDVNYGDDTIFVEGNRIVSGSNLSMYKNMQIFSNNSNTGEEAKLVSLLADNREIFDRVYIGAIEDVNEYSISLKNYASVKDIKFGDLEADEKELQMYDDIQIYDVNLDKQISRNIFFNGDYYRKEYKKSDNKGLRFKRYYGVFLCDDSGNLVATKIRHKGILENDLLDDNTSKEEQLAPKVDKIVHNLMFSRGRIGEFNKKWQRISLYNSFNYFDYHSEWRPNVKNTVFSLRNAMIIRNNKMIKYDDLSLDDSIYCIRNDDEALVVFVE